MTEEAQDNNEVLQTFLVEGDEIKTGGEQICLTYDSLIDELLKHKYIEKDEFVHQINITKNSVNFVIGTKSPIIQLGGGLIKPQ